MSEEENIEQPTDDRPLSTEIISEPSTINDQPITNMEVHHSHHPTHKKKLREYLLEFFMLFLAVFLGFVAENIRENIGEHKRGIEYIKSFSEDLQKDTLQYASLIRYLKEQDSITDNMFNCYDTISRTATSTDCLNQIILNTMGFADFIYTDRTIQQLKNAGGLRLIHDKDVADSIITYDALVRAELIHQDGLEVYQQKAIDANTSMINFSALRKLYYPTKDNDKVQSELLLKSKEQIDKYFNVMYIFKINLRAQIGWLKLLKNTATRLIVFLNQKSQ